MFGKACSSKDSIGIQKWQTLCTKSEKWDGLDKYGDLFKSTDWDAGPANNFICQSCYITLSSSRALNQAIARMQNQQNQCSSSSHTGKNVYVNSYPPF